MLVADRALETSRLRRENVELKARALTPNRIVGRSTSANQLRQVVDKVGPANSRVLIAGAPGTGKELAARMIHDGSSRAASPFVVINAATMVPEMMETELFGVEGAKGEAARWGLSKRPTAERCSSTKSPTCRARRRVRSFASWSTRTSSASVAPRGSMSTSASFRPRAAICPLPSRKERFREDLFHRLAVVPIRVPALSERRDDIPELIEVFMEQVSAHTGLPRRKIGNDAMAVLQSHDWPGNIRQLRNNVERLMILAAGDAEAEITADMLPSEIGTLVPATPNGAGGEKLMSLPLREAREVFEREYLVAQISRFGGNISRTAEFIGMERSALHRKLKSLGID